jgi:beta-lactamase class D
MRIKFYTDSDNPLWDDMKRKVCQNILDNIVGDTKLKYYIHFDKMLFNIGWFVGYVEIWKGKRPYERKVRRIPFTAHVIDWGQRDDCKKRASYRVKYSQNVRVESNEER